MRSIGLAFVSPIITVAVPMAIYDCFDQLPTSADDNKRA
jgi:hypothetical protein